ncbi:hypothetical protein NN561_007689 [Cricetulus griseus]
MDDCEVQSSVVNEVLTLKGFVSDHGPPAFATSSQGAPGIARITAQGRARLSLRRRRTVPAALARAPLRVVRRWPSRLPLDGALPFTTAGDIQQDWLAQRGSRGVEAGAPASVCSSHRDSSRAAAASTPAGPETPNRTALAGGSPPPPGSTSFCPPCPPQLRRRARTKAASARGTGPPCSYMAKFLAALLGCTLPSKGASPMLEVGRGCVLQGLPSAGVSISDPPLGSPPLGKCVSPEGLLGRGWGRW